MIYTHFAAAILGACVAFGGAWNIQKWRYEEKISSMKAEYAVAQANAVAKARQESESLQAKKDEALNAATKRANQNAAAAADAKSLVDGLRIQLETASRELSSYPERTQFEYYRTQSELFQQCARRLAELAEKADGHASDAVMLQQAWPK